MERWASQSKKTKSSLCLKFIIIDIEYKMNFSTWLTDYDSWKVSFRGENSKAFAFHYIFMKYKHDLQIMIYRKRPLGSRVKSFLASHILRYKFYSKSTELVKTIRLFLKTLMKYNRNKIFICFDYVLKYKYDSLSRNFFQNIDFLWRFFWNMTPANVLSRRYIYLIALHFGWKCFCPCKQNIISYLVR